MQEVMDHDEPLGSPSDAGIATPPSTLPALFHYEVEEFDLCDDPSVVNGSSSGNHCDDSADRSNDFYQSYPSYLHHPHGGPAAAAAGIRRISRPGGDYQQLHDHQECDDEAEAAAVVLNEADLDNAMRRLEEELGLVSVSDEGGGIDP